MLEEKRLQNCLNLILRRTLQASSPIKCKREIWVTSNLSLKRQLSQKTGKKTKRLSKKIIFQNEGRHDARLIQDIFFAKQIYCKNFEKMKKGAFLVFFSQFFEFLLYLCFKLNRISSEVLKNKFLRKNIRSNMVPFRI